MKNEKRIFGETYSEYLSNHGCFNKLFHDAPETAPLSEKEWEEKQLEEERKYKALLPEIKKYEDELAEIEVMHCIG